MNLPFTSIEQFHQQFNQGLYQLIEKNQLGPFILCLANATNDKQLFSQLESALKIQFQQLLKNYQKNLKSGKLINAVEEDLQVFLKLHALGFDSINLTQQRHESDWLCQFNQLRSFRPQRISAFEHNEKMSTPFVESQFHFNKPFMAKECFWSGEYNGQAMDVFYNKYPFADYHALLVPQREKCLPQMLTERMHYYVWQLLLDWTAVLPGLSVAYNSYGAYASVNHLHFQMFIQSPELPISSLKWCHNGGDVEYPVKVLTSFDSKDSWRIIADLHVQNQPYNLLFIENKVYIIARKVQGSVDVPEWSSGFTWSELCGAVLLFNKDAYEKISDKEIYRYLNMHSV